jgi:hypothetical protein
MVCPGCNRQLADPGRRCPVCGYPLRQFVAESVRRAAIATEPPESPPVQEPSRVVYVRVGFGPPLRIQNPGRPLTLLLLALPVLSGLAFVGLPLAGVLLFAGMDPAGVCWHQDVGFLGGLGLALGLIWAGSAWLHRFLKQFSSPQG